MDTKQRDGIVKLEENDVLRSAMAVLPQKEFGSNIALNVMVPKCNEFVDMKPFKLPRISEDSFAAKSQDQFFKYDESKRSISVIHTRKNSSFGPLVEQVSEMG